MSISATAAATSAASSGFILKSLSIFTPNEVGDTPPDGIVTVGCSLDVPTAEATSLLAGLERKYFKLLK